MISGYLSGGITGQAYGPVPTFSANTPKTKTQNPASTTAIVRLVLKGAPKPDSARQILQDALKQWPENCQAKYFMLPGGFAEADWPKAPKNSDPKSSEGDSGWLVEDGNISPLVQSASLTLSKIITPGVLRLARGKTRYLSVGIDVLGEQGLKAPHAELVAVVDVNTGKVIRWTGKSYPTASQENKLLPVEDLDSHFLELGNDRVMVLGCNDLNMFSPRVHANQKAGSSRSERCLDMVSAANAFKPNVILQHPHATDTPNIWRMAWMALAQSFPDLKVWASAIRYFNPRGDVRKPLENVLAKTRSDEAQVLDLVLETDSYDSAPSRYMQGFKKF